MEVLEDAQPYRRKGQEVKFFHQGERQVFLDRKKFRYVMVNLLSNAMKYSGEDKEIFLTSACTDENVVVSVKDNGIGIPLEEQQQVFGKFFRAKNTGVIQGTGLGLTIVKRYVELMQGQIGFTSHVDNGTTFTVELPNSKWQ